MPKIIMLSAAVLQFLALTGCRKPPTPPPAPESLSEPQAQTGAVDAEHSKKAGELINAGLMYLLKNRDADSAWSANGAMKPAITALALKAMVQHPDFDASSAVVKKPFEVLLGYKQADGGIYDPAEGYYTYATAVAISALAAAQDPRYTSAIREAQGYLRSSQITPGSDSPDGSQVAQEDPRVGGVGYGTGGQPNLSVLSFWMDAMNDAGTPADDPSVQRAASRAALCKSVQAKVTDAASFVSKPAATGSDTPALTFSATQSSPAMPLRCWSKHAEKPHVIGPTSASWPFSRATWIVTPLARMPIIWISSGSST